MEPAHTEGDAPAFQIYGLPIKNRACGSCTLCCTLVPVDLHEGHKDGGVKCRHVCSRGCRIYKTRPDPCQYWSCRWLFDPDAAGLKRPDISGYIVDSMLDTIVANDQPVKVLQIWMDPVRPDAHRAPELRAYLELMGAKFGTPAIVRWGKGEGLFVVPPSLSSEGDWLEMCGILESEEHLNRRIVAAGGSPRGIPPGATLSAEFVEREA